MLINRSEYFATFVKDTFYEVEMEDELQVLRFGDISAPVLACVLYHVYTEDFLPPVRLIFSVTIKILWYRLIEELCVINTFGLAKYPHRLGSAQLQ